MTDPFVHDDALEAVLRSRAGDGAPADLHALILAAVAADGPRATARRSVRHPWRLLAVAAVLFGTIGTALFVGGQRQTAVVTPTPSPSHLAVTNPSADTSPPPAPSIPLPSATDSSVPSDAQSLTLGAPSGSCTQLRADAEQAGITIGPWAVGKRGDASAVTNGLIAANDGIDSNTIRLVDSTTGKNTRIPAFKAASMGVIDWSPTGAALALDASTIPGGPGGCTGLFIWSATGIVEVAYRRQFSDIAWSPTGSAIAYVAFGGDDTEHMYVSSVDGSTRDLGSICGDCSFTDTPIWSPDGARIATSWLTADQSDSRLSILNVQEGTWTEVPHSAGYRLDDAGFSPNAGLSRWLDASTLLLGTSHGYASIAVDKAEMPATRVTWPPAQFGTISPDLKWWTDLGCIHCVSTLTSRETGRTRRYWDSTAVNVAWAPNSRQLVVSVGTSVAKPGLWVVNVDGTGLHRVTSTIPTNLAWQPVWP